MEGGGFTIFHVVGGLLFVKVMLYHLLREGGLGGGGILQVLVSYFC